MPKFTKDQQKAIDISNKSVIVSASAGSGKTAVLTERVIEKIKKGISISELLVLTFTEKAASEMKDRIRTKLIDEGLTDELSKLESASISTFDAYALELVKKYSYVLNIEKDIKITDSNIVKLYQRKLLDEIFDEKYIEKENNFLELIKIFCVKDDKNIKDLIIEIYNNLDLVYDKEKYLNEYTNYYFNDKYLDEVMKKYINLIKEKISFISVLLDRLRDYDDEYYYNVYNILEPLISSNTLEEIKTNTVIKIPNVPRNSVDEVKNIKQNIKEELDNVNKMLELERSSLLLHKDLIQIVIDILKILDKRVTFYKKDNNIYTFSDIYKLSISLVTDYEEIKEELKNKYHEIMIDEYQDTNDLQEMFTSRIDNNNLYMVGDVKQSIYRFRNANPDIFNEKYNNYKLDSRSEVIDLNKNFRSRDEVLKNINIIFDELMKKDISFIDYEKEHRMEFGLSTYSEEKESSDYNIDIYTYNLDKNQNKEETEIFMIALDIKEKLKNRIKVFDKKTNKLREVEYSDFAILIDRSTSFDLYKKIFEYLGIPLNIEKDYDLSLEDDIYIFKNIMKILIKIKDNSYDEEFKYLYLSIGRSFLYRYSDQELFVALTSNKYKDSDLYNKCVDLSKKIDILPISEIFIEIINTFNYYERLTYINNISLMQDRVKSIYELLKSLEEVNETIYEVVDVLDKLLEEDNIKIKVTSNNNDSVNLMTIHKSKGLEFPICYYSGLYKEFNFRSLYKSLMYNKNYGIITNLEENSIYKYLINNEYKQKEIDEKTRLLYVALTRAREKMIIVMPKIEEVTNELNIYTKSKFKSFLDMFKAIYPKIEKYIKEKDTFIDKNYKYFKDVVNNISTSNKIEVTDFKIDNEILKKDHYSKRSNIITKEERNKMDYGTKVHEILEYINLNNPSMDDIKIDENIKDKINSFINSDLIKNNKNSKFYKEYEFIYNNNHGIIDLLIENDDEVIIVDYKLKNIDDIEYNKQLLGYKEYMKKITNKSIKIYLYSIYDELLKEIEEEI